MSQNKHEAEEHRGHSGGHHGHGGGGHEGEHEGAPEWLISFADNVTLMMGFFVILLAMNLKPASGGSGESPRDGSKQGSSAGPTPEMLDVAVAIRSAFNNPVDLGSTDPQDLVLIQHLMRRRAEGEALQPGLKGLEQDVQSIRPGKYYTLGGRISFGGGSADLSEPSRKSARELGKRFHGTRYIVEVRGHASTAEAVKRSDRGLSFSYERALVVAEELVASGVVWGQIRIIACGDNDPYGASPTEDGAEQSDQRVEVIVRGDLLPEDVNISPPAPGADSP